MRNEFHYCVLGTQVLKQWEVTKVINQALPGGCGEIFYPCVELWLNGKEKSVIKPLFPGYLFIRSNLGFGQLHELIRQHRPYVESFIGELHLNMRKNAEDYDDYICAKPDEFVFTDLSDDEAQFLDFVLNFTGRDEDAGCGNIGEVRKAGFGSGYAGERSAQVGGQGNTANRAEESTIGKSASSSVSKKLPERGVFRLSYGYRENGKYVVMEGPLKGREEHIVTADIRDHKAYLDVKINGHLTRVGLMIKPKKNWFPDEADAAEVLADGRETDIEKLKRKMGGLS